MFPACAGMNRKIQHDQHRGRDVPRVRGDEPRVNAWLHGVQLCSPRARG